MMTRFQFSRRDMGNFEDGEWSRGDDDPSVGVFGSSCALGRTQQMMRAALGR
jgi:hypothetical protein